MSNLRKYFGTDGIRGRVGATAIHPEFILKLGWAAGRVLAPEGGGLVVIGKDTRISGYMFESALEAGLSAAGVGVRLLGPMPTPGIAYLTRTLHASAGIVISASHNPHHDNGIKFFSAEGHKLPDDVEAAIEAMLEQPLTLVPSERLGKAERVDDAAGRYIEFCKASVPYQTNLHGLRIAVDCAHGAAYHIAPQVLRELGAQVIELGVSPDGLNINTDCGAVHPQGLARAVVEQGADLGIALDGDADRVILVDHEGAVVDGDEILFILARARHAAGQLRGAVVGTLMSNMGLELALREQGIGFERTAVGDRYVIEKLRAEGWNLGGEPSGHIICMDRTTTGDGIVAALQVLHAMRASGQSLKALKAGMQRLPQVMLNVPVQGVFRLEARPEVQAALQAAESRLAGRGRVVLRPSGTEPVVRVTVEGADAAQVRALAESLADTVRRAA
jgi:phosphoglucosamine mutase